MGSWLNRYFSVVAEMQLLLPVPDRWLATASTVAFMNNCRCIVNRIFSGLLDRFPSLNFVLVESGLGYIPFLLESCQYQTDENLIDRGGLELRPPDLPVPGREGARAGVAGRGFPSASSASCSTRTRPRSTGSRR